MWSKGANPPQDCLINANFNIVLINFTNPLVFTHTHEIGVLFYVINLGKLNADVTLNAIKIKTENAIDDMKTEFDVE